MAIADPPVAIPSPPPTAEEARTALAAAWAFKAPRTAEDVAAFYRDCPGTLLAADLEAFHNFPERQRWTEAFVHVAREYDARLVVDIGSGAGHDVLALLDALPSTDVCGVEPNDDLRDALLTAVTDRALYPRASVATGVEYAPIERADVLGCFDVLEHVPDPEAFLYGIAMRAKIGCRLVETTATHDCGTPLHLETNRGWHPGRALRRAGWECVDESGRLRVWQRLKADPIERLPIVVCANREVSVQTHDSILRLMYSRTNEYDWSPGRAAESGLLRARSVWASKWWREYADDGFLMVDSDIEFQPEDAEKVVALGREKRGIAVAAYPVRDGGHLTVRGLTGEVEFGPGAAPTEIRWGGTGFMYVHRDVLDAMIPTLTLCHANQPWAVWPMFDFKIVEDDYSAGFNWLSEDWWFCERARQLGFGVWMDPSVMLTHWGLAPVTIANMESVHTIHSRHYGR